MATSPTLDRLAALGGIEPRFTDAWGAVQETADSTREALLHAMGFPCATESERRDSIARIEAEASYKPLSAAIVLRHRRREPLAVPVRLPAATRDRAIDWRLEHEDGEVSEGRIRPGELVRSTDREATVSLPVDPPFGYHRLSLRGAGLDAETSLIVAPPSCYLPEGLAGRRVWGIGAQLYGLRSAFNWGIGDFGDLADLAEAAAGLGADFIGLNPLHALFPDRPEHVSPYSPSSRAFLNGLYLDLEDVPGFADCRAAQEICGSPEFQSLVAAARASELVDYSVVARLKLPVLRALYDDFRTAHLGDPGGASTEAGRSFRQFQASGGRRLECFGTFEALSEHFGSGTGWRDWPAAYRNPDSSEVTEFARTHRERVEFSHFMQWLCDAQLRTAAERSDQLGMAVGLYHDVALGADGGGADGWIDQRLLAEGASLGAPPDDWNLKGQNWGITPRSPFGLRQDAYRTEAALLAANMRHGGALRLDHVMALQRLYWIPLGGPPGAGAYVRYPFDDLLGILALESHRAKCLVIGEDLGTVPSGFRERMSDENILSYRLLFFERDRSGELTRPRRYPARALASVTTHDLATLPGFWKGRDLSVRAALDLFPSPEAEAQSWQDRALDRSRLVHALVEEKLLPDDWRAEDFEDMPFEMIVAVYRYLARSPSSLLAVHLEDPLGIEDQPNLPGTVDEHPNWRRKIPLAIEELAADTRIQAVAKAIGDIRPHGARSGAS